MLRVTTTILSEKKPCFLALLDFVSRATIVAQASVVRFLGNRPSLKNVVSLWNFNIGVNGKYLKCGISRKRLIVEWNGRKFGTRGITGHLLGYFWWPIPWVWFEVIRCTLQNFRFYDFQNATSNNFHWIPSKLRTLLTMGEYRLLHFLAIG